MGFGGANMNKMLKQVQKCRGICLNYKNSLAI